MRKVLFLCNIPAPYRIDFFNELGRFVDLTVLFEAKSTPAAAFNYNLERIRTFRTVFLREGDIRERRVDWNVLSHFHRGEYDTIVVTNYAFFTETAAILALKAKRIPYEMELDGAVPRKENALLHAAKGILIRGAARYWSTGEQTDRFLLGFGVPKERITRYPFTSLFEREIAERPFSDAEKQAAKRKLSVPYKRMILSVGRPLHLKGFDLLIRAAAGLDGDAGVCIVGGKPTPECAELAERLGLKNIRFIEFADRETLAAYYRAADLFVLATRGDVWGLVINEAMANALPVITTDACVAGCEMIRDGENGFLIPSESAELLEERMRRLLGDEALRTRMGGAALSTARRYTIEQMARAHAEAFSAYE